MKDEKYMCSLAGIVKKDTRYLTRKGIILTDLREAILQSTLEVFIDFGLDQTQASKVVENYEFILPFLDALKLASRRIEKNIAISEK